MTIMVLPKIRGTLELIEVLSIFLLCRMRLGLPYAGFCLCTEAACLSSLGTYICDAPELPSTVHPPPPSPSPTQKRVVIQAGMNVPQPDGTLAYYNDTVDAEISTQYLAPWNDMQVNGSMNCSSAEHK